MLKKILFASTLLVAAYSNSQTTAMDFTQDDCNGNPHHLFQDLEDGNVVILEFFMTNCGSCVVAGNKLESVKADLLASFPNKLKSYAFGFSNSYTSAQVLNWVNTNSFTSYPMTTGAAQVAYYGGMGMPTVVVLGGTNHDVIAGPYQGLTGTDTTEIGNNSRTYLTTKANVEEIANNGMVKIYPNPADKNISVNFEYLGKKIDEFTISDLTGKVVFTKSNFSSKELTLNISSFENGIYNINVISDSKNIQEKLNILH